MQTIEDFLLQLLRIHLERWKEFETHVHDLRDYCRNQHFDSCSTYSIHKSIMKLSRLNFIKCNKLSDTNYYFYK